MAKYRSIDLFAGIGGIRLGFDNAFGKDIETFFVSEWDEFAQKTYGEVLAFHLYDRDMFKRYLFDSTKFETGDTSKHKFGKIEIDNQGNMTLKLNLQIRFRK